MQEKPVQPISTILEKATTVKELIEQLQKFDEATPFTPFQRLMHVKIEDKECICFTEINTVI